MARPISMRPLKMPEAGNDPAPPADRLAWATLAALALFYALTFRDYGLGWDDYAQWQYGHMLLDLYTSGLRDRSAFDFANIYLYGGAFDLASAALETLSPVSAFETRRLLGAALGLAGAALVWRLARRLGGPVAGLCAVLLLAVCPAFVGHMPINSKDGPFAVAVLGVTYALCAAAEAWPRPKLVHAVALGLALGVALGTRVAAASAVLFTLPAAGLLLAATIRTEGIRSGLGTAGGFALRLLPALPVAYLVMVAAWPWAALEPLNPVVALKTFADFPDAFWPELFDGREVMAPDMPRHYVPLLFSLTMPELFLGAGLAGLAGALIAAFRGDLPPSRRAALLVVAAAATVPIALAVIVKPVFLNGVRHYLFVIPPLAVLGGLAVSFAVRRLWARSRAAACAAAAAALVGAALPVQAMIALHPYHYAYFNETAGGLPGATDRFMTDYWGLSFKQAARSLKREMAKRGLFERPDGGPWRVATCGPHKAAQVALGPAFETTYDTRNADFVLTLGQFYCAPMPFNPLVTVRRDGVPLARAYDVRGKSLVSVFAGDPFATP